MAGYERAYIYSTNPNSYLPLVTVASISMDSADAVEEALGNADGLTAFGDIAEIDDFDGGDAENVVAFSYTAPAGNLEAPDSVRVFLQAGSTLFMIDVQGEDDLETAQALAENLVAAQLSCIESGDCSVILKGDTF